VSHDKHLRVGYSAAVLPPMPPRGATPPPPPPEAFEWARQINYGFERVERLAGNIGYLDLRQFGPPPLIGDAAAAAMTFLANASAVIIDLRQNGGGSPDAVALLASYFFDGPPVRLNDIYDRPTNETRQFRTLPYVPGKRLADKDLYILTSARTFSAAEDFTYALKNLKRATIVGEVTGGGAHPVAPHRLGDHFMIGVPSGRSISSITNTDWEGIGVEPDIKVPAAKALATAHLKALEKRGMDGVSPRLHPEVESAIERLKKELSGT
jgi:retinol-binding protein 3